MSLEENPEVWFETCAPTAINNYHNGLLAKIADLESQIAAGGGGVAPGEVARRIELAKWEGMRMALEHLNITMRELTTSVEATIQRLS